MVAHTRGIVASCVFKDYFLKDCKNYPLNHLQEVRSKVVWQYFHRYEISWRTRKKEGEGRNRTRDPGAIEPGVPVTSW